MADNTAHVENTRQMYLLINVITALIIIKFRRHLSEYVSQVLITIYEYIKINVTSQSMTLHLQRCGSPSKPL
jgi:hypothetical protein